jgi:hypothetical protein
MRVVHTYFSPMTIKRREKREEAGLQAFAILLNSGSTPNPAFLDRTAPENRRRSDDSC